MTAKSTAAASPRIGPATGRRDMDRAVGDVIAAGRFCAARGWVPATSGNFSVRIDAESVAMTATGTDKGALTPADVLVVAAQDGSEPRASAEAALHLALYRALPDVGAVFHVHSLVSAIAGELHAEAGRVVLRGAELLKALDGIGSHEAAVDLPVFANSQDIPALAAAVVPRVTKDPAAKGFLLAGHGLYAWGRDAAQARRHLEALDYLLTYTLELERFKR